MSRIESVLAAQARHARVPSAYGAVSRHAAAVDEVAALRARIAELERQLVDERTDPLTGLATRRTFYRSAAVAYPHAGGVLLADLDGFKRLNDTYGHQAGDAVLAAFGHRWRRIVGTSAAAGRLGGDEFAAVATAQIGDRQLDGIYAVLTATVTVPELGPICPGVSLGLAHAAQLDGTTFAEGLHAADLAMYAAKHTGKPWCVYDPHRDGPAAIEDRPSTRTTRHG